VKEKKYEPKNKKEGLVKKKNMKKKLMGKH
jgi:hypothetical protein